MPLSEPPRDAKGQLVPHDHQDILNDDGLIRRIPIHWVVPDEKSPTGRRLSSEAFEMSSAEMGGGMSLDIEKLIVETGKDVAAHVTPHPWVGAVRVTAGLLRGYALQVGYSPQLDNPYHAEAWGTLSKKTSKKIRLASTWVVEIEGCSLEA